MKKRVISLVLCLLMALSLIPTTAFAVDADPSAEAGSTGTAGEVTVNKTAAPVEGMVNTWDITLTVTAKDPTPAPPNAQDVVLVIDNSNSMYDSNWFSHSRMYYAKAAAKKFIDSLLPTGSGNRVAIVYFGNDAHSNNAFMALIIRRAQRTMSIVFLSIAMNIRAVPISRLLSILPLVF